MVHADTHLQRSKAMAGSGYDVVVTSPDYVWLGTSLEQERPPILGVLVGKNIKLEERDMKESLDDELKRMSRQSREMDIVALLFVRDAASWHVVPTQLHGQMPYIVEELLTINFFNTHRYCKTDEEQQKLVGSLGLAIDGEFVGV